MYILITIYTSSRRFLIKKGDDLIVAVVAGAILLALSAVL